MQWSGEVVSRVTVMRSEQLSGVRSAFNQLLVVILINVPTVSFGLALGWVSLASGESAADVTGDARGDAAGAGAVTAAVTTFAASLVGVPLFARALSYGRKFAVIATSVTFIICWSLKLVGGFWCVTLARAAAGLGGAGAWALAPLLAREMCEERWRGAAAAALVLAHNAGVLLMYLAADARLRHTTVLWSCLGLSLCHCFVFLFVPESPAFLAAKGKSKQAEQSLRWLRGSSSADDLSSELAALPLPEAGQRSAFALAKEMLSDKQRLRAFVIGGLAVVGQEACGVLALLQYAERVFVLARDAEPEGLGGAVVDGVGGGGMVLASPARHALILGIVQLIAAAIAVYLVERIGRRPLIVWSALSTGAFLAAGAALVGVSWARVGQVSGAALALAAAVAADSAGLQPAPYALIADMFHYEYRSCALMLVTAAGSIGNTVEVGVFPLVASWGGLSAAVALAATITLSYAVFAFFTIPETRGRTPEEIYEEICPSKAQKNKQIAFNNQNSSKAESINQTPSIDDENILKHDTNENGKSNKFAGIICCFRNTKSKPVCPEKGVNAEDLNKSKLANNLSVEVIKKNNREAEEKIKDVHLNLENQERNHDHKSNSERTKYISNEIPTIQRKLKSDCFVTLQTPSCKDKDSTNL